MKTILWVLITLVALNLSASSAKNISSFPFLCNTTDRELLSKAFKSVSGFNISWFRHVSSSPNCSDPPIVDLNLSAKSLAGVLTWRFLRNMSRLQTLDLSRNSLEGSPPKWLWSIPTLVEVNLSENLFGGAVRFEPPNGSSTSPLRFIDLSANRFTSLARLPGLKNLTSLDLSGNKLGALPSGLGSLSALERFDISGCDISGSVKNLSSLQSLKYLDVSNNSLAGDFPSDFPPLVGLAFLNISHNNFTARIAAKEKRFYEKKFGESAFISAGKNFSSTSTTTMINSSKTHPSNHKNSTSSFRSAPQQNHHRNNQTAKSHHREELYKESNRSRRKPREWKKKREALVLGLSCGGSLFGLVSMGIVVFLYRRRKRAWSRKNKWAISKPVMQSGPLFRAEKSGPFAFETESGTSWTADIKEATSAAVVMFEKPLMKHLTFKDLMAATSHFGKDSLLAEGRCGPVYTAVLPGSDIHVAIKVLDSARDVPHDDAVSAFEHLSALKHPNLLPLSGYCIAGNSSNANRTVTIFSFSISFIFF